MPHDAVPDGADERDNVELRRRGEPPRFGFAPQGTSRSASVWACSISRRRGHRQFTLRHHERTPSLHRALTQFMLDLHTGEHGYRECYVPYIANAEALTGTGQLPKFEEDLFALGTESPFI